MVSSVSRSYLVSSYINSKISIVVLILVASLVADTSFIKIYDLIGKRDPWAGGPLFFLF
jgi:hypothetical protein